MPDLAVVIVSWNVRDLLAPCLASLMADLDQSGLTAAIWVVDNASTDGTPEMVRGEFPAIHLLPSRQNLGFAGGNNLALRQILASEPRPVETIWLLNPDTEVRRGATSTLLSVLQTRPQVGVAGPKLLYPDRSLQQSVFRFPGLVQLLFELFPLPTRLYDTPLNGRYRRGLYDGEHPFSVDHPLGAAMMLRTAALVRVGLLDEQYHMYCEEIDWCWRLRLAGWRAVCVPAAQVTHHAGQSTAQIPLSSFVNLWSSRARLYARYHRPLTLRVARALVRAGMGRRMRGGTPDMVAACRQVLRAWEIVD